MGWDLGGGGESLAIYVRQKGLTVFNKVNLETLRGRLQLTPTPLDFFGFKFLLLDRLSKALAQLFLVCEHIF